MYTKQHLTMAEIASIEGISRGAVAKILRQHNVKAEQGEWVDVRCPTCGKPFRCQRKRWRTTGVVYCQAACYYGKRANPDYVQSRHGQRKARQAVVDAGFPLLKTHVVHHHDGDNRNNAIENLAVFESQRDHMRHHHGTPGLAIWDGRLIARAAETRGN